jgi:hypothetical protein
MSSADGASPVSARAGERLVNHTIVTTMRMIAKKATPPPTAIRTTGGPERTNAESSPNGVRTGDRCDAAALGAFNGGAFGSKTFGGGAFGSETFGGGA